MEKVADIEYQKLTEKLLITCFDSLWRFMENLLIVVTEKEFPTSELFFSGRFSNTSFDNFEKEPGRAPCNQLLSRQVSRFNSRQWWKFQNGRKSSSVFRVAKICFVSERAYHRFDFCIGIRSVKLVGLKFSLLGAILDTKVSWIPSQKIQVWKMWISTFEKSFLVTLLA